MSKCGSECEVYSRCCGYFRPVVSPGKNKDGTRRSSWNLGKREEFKERKTYSVSGAMRTVKRQDDIMQARTA